MSTSVRKRSDELSQADLFGKIGDICAAVTIATNAKELLEISLKMTMDLFHAKRGSIFLMNESGTELILKIAQGMEISEQENMVKRLGEGIVGRVAQIKEPIIVEDITQDSRFPGFKSRGNYHTPSFICVPLMLKDKLIGVVNIADKESGHRFSKDELQLLDFLGSQIALNYLRTQLYNKLKHLIKESRTLKDELGRSSQEASYLKKQIVVQEKLASIGKLAGGIAHEFNNPLDGVIRYTNLSLEQVKDNEVLHGYLLEIKQGLNRMANIVRSLLACARNSFPSMQKVDINQIVEQSVAAVKSDIFHKNISLKQDLAQDLPQTVDLGIERILSNLLRNAIDAIDSNGEIKIKTFSKEKMLYLQVSDTGCGIPQEALERIFEPFFTTKDMERGCGLGLTIVNEIVRHYNGKIEVESSAKKGTIFTVTLPITA